MSAKEVIDRHSELKSDRTREEGTWRDIARVLRPDDQDFDAASEPTTDTDLFDSSPLYSLDTFVGGMFSQSVNPATRWFELGLPDADLAKFPPVRAWLWRRANQIYASASPSSSSFYARAPAWLANLGAFGWGPFWQEEDLARGQIVDLALPIGQVYLDRDSAGFYNQVNREFMLSGRQVAHKFGAERARAWRVDDKRKYIIVHAVSDNPEFDPRALGPRGMPWRSVYCSPDIRDMEVVGGYHEMPAHIPAWNERAKSPYPTGPGHLARHDAMQLQEMERSFIVRAQFDAEPPLLLRSEAALTVADLFPNAALQGTMSDDGKAQAQYLEKRGQMTLAAQQSEQRRNAIRTAFFFGLMQVALARPQMTATEFIGLQEETLKLMAPNLVRVQTGGLSPWIGRRYRMLERAGEFAADPPPPELAGQRITIEYVSPLDKVMKLALGRGVLQLQQAFEQLALTDPSIRDHFDADAAAPVLADAFSTVPNILRDPRAVAELRQARAQAQQQQAGLATLAQQVNIAAEASHAQQAASLSQQRARPQ